MIDRTASPNSQTGNRPPGVVDTLGAAFSVVAARPHLMIIPLLLDAVLLAGIRFSPKALFERASFLDPVAGRTDLDIDLLVLPTLFVPSFLSSNRASLFQSWDGATVHLATWQVLALLPLTVMAAFFAGLIYRMPLAVAAGRPPYTRSHWFGELLTLAWQLVSVVLIIGAALLFLLTPFLVLATVAWLAGVNIWSLVILLITLVAITTTIFSYFVFDAIFVSNSSPVRAVYLSFGIVRRYPPLCLGLIACSLLLSLGLPYAWLAIAVNPFGLFVAVLGNAAIATALILTSMSIYFNCLRTWLPGEFGGLRTPPR